MQAVRKVALIALAAALLLLCTVPAPAAAEWSGSAKLENTSVTVNFMERFEVTVTNDGAEPMEITDISVTVQWGTPVLYHVFEGSTVLASGESRTFEGPPTRMPTTDPGTYPCFVAVTARGADGAVQERQFPGTLEAKAFGIHVAGMPEEVFVPLAVVGTMLLLTLLLFRFERTPGWPPFRSVPRWRRR